MIDRSDASAANKRRRRGTVLVLMVVVVVWVAGGAVWLVSGGILGNSNMPALRALNVEEGGRLVLLGLGLLFAVIYARRGEPVSVRLGERELGLTYHSGVTVTVPWNSPRMRLQIFDWRKVDDPPDKESCSIRGYGMGLGFPITPEACDDILEAARMRGLKVKTKPGARATTAFHRIRPGPKDPAA